MKKRKTFVEDAASSNDMASSPSMPSTGSGAGSGAGSSAGGKILKARVRLRRCEIGYEHSIRRMADDTLYHLHVSEFTEVEARHLPELRAQEHYLEEN